MISAKEAKEINRRKAQEKLDTFMIEKQKVFNTIEKEITKNAENNKTCCRVPIGYAELEPYENYYLTILHNFGYKVRIDKGLLYISWE